MKYAFLKLAAVAALLLTANAVPPRRPSAVPSIRSSTS